MRIGFHATMAFHNGTGLGHYSRTLIHSLADAYPDHEYFLFNEKGAGIFHPVGINIHEVRPAGVWKLLPGLWRRGGMKSEMKRLNLDLYHGLDHELPRSLTTTSIKTAVSIHDLIPERFPELYTVKERKRFRNNVLQSCMDADAIVSISGQTTKDLEAFYGISGSRVHTCYQACNPAFMHRHSDAELKAIHRQYGLPEKYFLYVSSVIERKNLLGICKALFLLRHEFRIPLVVIGLGGDYMKRVKDYVVQHSLRDRIMFLSETPAARNSEGFRSARDLPAIYQQAVALIYPSLFEGFGIPVLEAMWSELPVIASNNSSIPEVGGDAVYYVNPHHSEEIAEAMRRIVNDQSFATELSVKGRQRAELFHPRIAAGEIMKLYNTLW